MKYIFLILIPVLLQSAWSAPLPARISSDLERFFTKQPQITSVNGMNNGQLNFYYSIRNITCLKNKFSECHLIDAPPNENLNPIKFYGQQADQLISILDQITPGALDHAGFDCAFNTQTGESHCRSVEN